MFCHLLSLFLTIYNNCSNGTSRTTAKDALHLHRAVHTRRLLVVYCRGDSKFSLRLIYKLTARNCPFSYYYLNATDFVDHNIPFSLFMEYMILEIIRCQQVHCLDIRCSNPRLTIWSRINTTLIYYLGADFIQLIVRYLRLA